MYVTFQVCMGARAETNVQRLKPKHTLAKHEFKQDSKSLSKG